jgi:hypothetical protein
MDVALEKIKERVKKIMNSMDTGLDSIVILSQYKCCVFRMPFPSPYSPF